MARRDFKVTALILATESCDVTTLSIDNVKILDMGNIVQYLEIRLAMINKMNLESVTRYVDERNMERLSEILEQVQQSQNIAYLAHVGYRASSPIFQLATKDNRYILMMPVFYEVYEYHDFVSDITYELDESSNLVVKYEDKVLPYESAEELRCGGVLNKVIAQLLKPEDILRDQDFIYKSS